MVGCGQFVCDGIFSHKSFKNFIAEMSTIITDYGSRGSKPRKKIFSFKNLTTTSLSFILQGMASSQTHSPQSPMYIDVQMN